MRILSSELLECPARRAQGSTTRGRRRGVGDPSNIKAVQIGRLLVRSFSSALCWRRVWRWMSLTVSSVDTFLPICLLLDGLQWVESLLYFSPSWCPSGFEDLHSCCSEKLRATSRLPSRYTRMPLHLSRTTRLLILVVPLPTATPITSRMHYWISGKCWKLCQIKLRSTLVRLRSMPFWAIWKLLLQKWNQLSKTNVSRLHQLAAHRNHDSATAFEFWWEEIPYRDRKTRNHRPACERLCLCQQMTFVLCE